MSEIDPKTMDFATDLIEHIDDTGTLIDWYSELTESVAERIQVYTEAYAQERMGQVVKRLEQYITEQNNAPTTADFLYSRAKRIAMEDVRELIEIVKGQHE